MTLDEYVARYRLLARSVEMDEELLRLMDRSAYNTFLRRFAEIRNPYFATHAASREAVEARKKRRERLSMRYAERLARAIAHIQSPVIRQYATCRYLYGMTQEDIARGNQLSLRTMYRRAAAARDALMLHWREVAPRVKRVRHKRFTCSRPLPRRCYALSSADRFTARCHGLGPVHVSQQGVW